VSSDHGRRNAGRYAAQEVTRRKQQDRVLQRGNRPGGLRKTLRRLVSNYAGRAKTCSCISSLMHITTGVSMNIDVVVALKRGDPEEIKKVQEKDIK
jgi:hypothetical protein